MKKKYIFILSLFITFVLSIFNTRCYAADLDRIVNYVVTVEPRMNDATLDITYEITWKVLDSTTEGPLEWVQIGTANSSFDTPTALTKNIRSITKYSGSYVKIVFNKAYYEGEQITFKYRLHQSNMHKISLGNCNFSFTPAWFTGAKIDNMTVKWNKDSVKSSNAKSEKDNYLIWNKTNMAKGEKITVDVKYDKSAFSSVSEYKSYGYNDVIKFAFIILILFIIIAIICVISSIGGGGGYYGHRGFYGGYGYRGYYGPRFHGPRHHGGCVRSSCACARSSCASSCACACAGSGRAGCSKKDFYGTKIDKNKLKKALK